MGQQAVVIRDFWSDPRACTHMRMHFEEAIVGQAIYKMQFNFKFTDSSIAGSCNKNINRSIDTLITCTCICFFSWNRIPLSLEFQANELLEENTEFGAPHSAQNLVSRPIFDPLWQQKNREKNCEKNKTHKGLGRGEGRWKVDRVYIYTNTQLICEEGSLAVSTAIINYQLQHLSYQLEQNAGLTGSGAELLAIGSSSLYALSLTGGCAAAG